MEPEKPAARVRVLFVCTGNICRSPSAEGVFRTLVRQAGLQDRVAADSAGTIDFHEGAPPDPQAVGAAARRGVDLRDLRARRFEPEDFEQHQYVLAMDSGHVVELREECPPDLSSRIRLFLDFAEGLEGRDVPDPYMQGAERFEEVLDLIEAGAAGLLAHIRNHDL